MARAETAWLRPPEPAGRAVASCCLCGEDICSGEEYLETELGRLCLACLEELTVREFAGTVLGLTTTIAYTD